MKNLSFLVVPILFSSLLHGATAISSGGKDRTEEWGYVEVRPKAHMFWWLYKSPYRVENPSKPWPTILWLQGGPGASGVGIGNFEEIGPLDSALKPRNFTWLRKADLLFVDNPVGTGFSYVEHKNLLVKTDEEAAKDLTTLLINVYNQRKSLQKSPLFFVAESYGGKYAVTTALSVLKAIEARKLKLKLGGVALGNSWMSSEDYVFSWGPVLKYVSRLDDNGLEISNKVAREIKKLIKKGKMVEATRSWGHLEEVISRYSNNVDFYNFMQDAETNSGSSTTGLQRYSNYLTSKRSSSNSGTRSLSDLLNGEIRKKLKIIPKNVQWGDQGGDVFQSLKGDFMKPRIKEVDKLLAKGINVTVYNGQVDLICATKGTEDWVKRLKWAGLKSFMKEDRKALYCKNEQGTKGFLKSYKNLHFYWILGAGHFVPTEQPCVALNMVGDITESPAKAEATST